MLGLLGTGTVGRPGPWSGIPRIPLIRPGWISPRLSFARAQLTGVESTNFDGTAWDTYAADAPRFGPSGLKIEGQRTGLFTNPRSDGLTAGIIGSGAAITGWSLSAAAAGTARIDAASEAGTTGFDLTILAAGSGTQRIAASVTASASLPYVMAPFVRLVSGSAASVTAFMRLVALPSAATTPVALGTQTTLTRVPCAVTTGGSDTSVRFDIYWTAPATAPVVYRVLWPTLEQASFASTPTLPPLAAPAASTRGADLVTASLSALGIPASGACTVLMSGVIPQAAPSGVTQALLQIDAGNENDRYILRNPAGGSAIHATRYTGGAAVGAALGTMTPGSAFRVGATIDSAGRMAALFEGGSVQAITGGPTSGLSTLRIGNNSASNMTMFGDVGYLDIIPRPLDDATLQRLVAAMPLAA